MLKRDRVRESPHPRLTEIEADDASDASLEELALCLSCGGMYMPARSDDHPARMVYSPARGPMCIEGPAHPSYQVMDAPPRDERSFCASVARLLLHNGADVSSVLTGSFLRNMN